MIEIQSQSSFCCCCGFRVAAHSGPRARMCVYACKCITVAHHIFCSYFIHCSLFLAQCKSPSDSSTAPFHQMCRTRFIAQHDCYHGTSAKYKHFYCILCCATNASFLLASFFVVSSFWVVGSFAFITRMLSKRVKGSGKRGINRKIFP